MRDDRAVRPEHASGVPSTASTEAPQAPDEPIGRLETANDPTGGTTWIRRRFRLPSADGADEALDAVLVVPGVARAALEPSSRELVADIEPGVVSDDELTAAIGRGGIEPDGWTDEPIPTAASDGTTDGGSADDGATGPSRDDPDDDIVEEESEDSFPASDPPSSWARSGQDDDAPGA
jgi:hypothetical protein